MKKKLDKISITKVNELRKKTGIGVLYCKNALIYSNGNIDKAIDFLRKKCKDLSLIRSKSIIKEGAVLSNVNSDYSFGTILGISCETDFLSKNCKFLNLLSIISKKSLFCNSKNKKDFLNVSCKEYNYKNVEEMILHYIGISGESIKLSVYEIAKYPFVMNYTHYNRIAVLVGFSSKLEKDVAKNIAMHITAMDPISIKKEGIPNNVLEKEIDIIRNQIKNEYSSKSKEKNQNIIEKILQGKIKKFILNNVLLSQKFIKNNKISVEEYLKNSSINSEIVFFKRIKV
ncbi:translation elongation factor Ts [Blattabacterium cuenoti]|uniref:translation elongation factor Ts n=1 Tax=Blattabacterium cuenoti TaxID=1653831 RepID=UPI00163CD770|nr:translation elongation factor Ts [Blattabacterium cuenoti]